MNIRHLGLLLAITLLTNCGTDNGSSSKIVGGNYVPTTSKSPAVSFMVKTNQFGQVRTCSGVRIGEKSFLTTYSCGEDLNKWGNEILFLATANGNFFSSLQVRSVTKHRFRFAESTDHERYTRGLSKVQLLDIPSQLASEAPVAERHYERLVDGQKLRSYGGGCDVAEDSGKCLATPVLQEGGPLKYLDTTVREEFTANEAVFKGDSDSSTTDGDQGGGVFDEQGRLVAVNIMVRDDFAPGFDTEPAFLWLGAREIQEFIKASIPNSPTFNQDPIYLQIYREASRAMTELENCGYGSDFEILKKLKLKPTGGVSILSMNLLSSELDEVTIFSNNDCIAPPGGDSREAWYRLQVTRLMLLDVAYEHLKAGDQISAKEAAKLASQIGLAVLDLSVGMIPIVGNAKSALECATGFGFIPPRALKNNEQVMSCLGVIFGQVKVWKAIFSGFTEASVSAKYFAIMYGDKTNDIAEFVMKGAQRVADKTPYSADEAANILAWFSKWVGPAKSSADIVVMVYERFKLVTAEEVEIFMKSAEEGHLLSQSFETTNYSKPELDEIVYQGILSEDSIIRIKEGSFDRYELVVEHEGNTVVFVFKRSGGVQFLSAFEE